MMGEYEATVFYQPNYSKFHKLYFFSVMSALMFFAILYVFRLKIGFGWLRPQIRAYVRVKADFKESG